MNQELVDENPRGDLLQGLDDSIGLPIEKAVQKYLPRDLARKVRSRTIEFLAEEIKPTQPPAPVSKGD